MQYEDGVKQVAEELRTNKNGAFGVAVRLAAEHGGTAEKLMADAAAYNEKGGASPAGTPALVDVDWPEPEVVERQILEAIQANFEKPIGQTTYTMVHCIVEAMMEERARFLQMLGK